MAKNGPTEKEKILRRLSEKEIRQQLYGFNSGYKAQQTIEIEPKEKETTAAPKEERKVQLAQQPAKPRAKAKIKAKIKIVQPKLLIQFALLFLFLTLIGVSVRYITRILSTHRQQNQRQSAVRKSYTAKPQKGKAVNKYQINRNKSSR